MRFRIAFMLLAIPVLFCGVFPLDTSYALATTTTVYILNTGDIHEHSTYLARISSYIKYFRSTHDNVIAIDTGDAISDYASDDPNNGSLYKLGTKGNVMFRIMSVIGYDLCTIGNHDVCHGVSQLATLINRWDIPVMGANLEKSPCALPLLSEKLIKFNHVSIGMVGTISTHSWHLKGSDKNTFSVASVRSGKVVAAVNAMKQKADIVLLVTHELDPDDQQSASAIPGIKLIVGGHSHKTTYQYLKKPGVSLMKAGWQGRYVSKLALTWDLQKKQIVGGTRELVDMASQPYEDSQVKKILQGPLVTKNNFNGDGATDLAVYEESTGTLRAISADGTWDRSWRFTGPEAGAVPVAGDFDGDGLSDPALYQESSGTWLMLLSGSEYAQYSYSLGGPGSTAAAADYDGDLITDRAVYDAASGNMIAALSSFGYAQASLPIGGQGCVPVTEYYDSDGMEEPATYQESTGLWTAAFLGDDNTRASVRFGGPGCLPVPGYYDGDETADVAVYRETTGEWIVGVSEGEPGRTMATLGGQGAIPVPGDYDGDGLWDPVVYEEDAGVWRLLLSGSNYFQSTVVLGGPDCVPVQ
ncbi:MAG: FG-GAP-like repeat-containing protein [Candidatus Aureabacteria bacterium]|nr:FG-GAP-like repeat-containing protein [Candidatus Auribacterota bacterium]